MKVIRNSDELIYFYSHTDDQDLLEKLIMSLPDRYADYNIIFHDGRFDADEKNSGYCCLIVISNNLNFIVDI